MFLFRRGVRGSTQINHARGGKNERKAFSDLPSCLRRGSLPADSGGSVSGGAKESTSGVAPSSTAVKELSLWDFHGAAEGEFFKSLPDLYAQVNPQVKITVQTVPWDDYLGTKLEAAFAAGAGPDLFFVSPGTIGKYINSGIAYSLNAFMTDTIVSDFSPSSIKGVSIGDKIYAIPFEIELVGLYYDADVLAAAGVQPPGNLG